MAANQPSSPFYSHPLLYQALIRFLYRKNFNERYQLVADQIPAGASVADVCAGDAYLYFHYLKQKSVSYIALDNSRNFGKWAVNQGVDYRNFNLFNDDIPVVDVVVMMGSLFQFKPSEKEVLQKMISSARHEVIITEPVSNLSSSHIGLVARLANRLTTPFEVPSHYTGERFNEEQFVKFISSFHQLQKKELIAGGREMLAVFKGEARP